jgi:hypothetical protein
MATRRRGDQKGVLFAAVQFGRDWPLADIAEQPLQRLLSVHELTSGPLTADIR